MQEPILRLKEIIWEVTTRCKNNCIYCGTKVGKENMVDNGKIITIAKAIAEYPPEQIDISGGDPLELPLKTHKEIVKILHEGGVTAVKIIVNPKSFGRCADTEKILDLYDWIGLSINDKADVKLFKDNIIAKAYMGKTTIITNFGAHNIFDYDIIEEVVGNKVWQVQFTITNQNPIYKNEGALKHFFGKLDVSCKKGKKVVPADNMNSGTCGAGRCSIGLLADGTVTPCLSMRSWKEPPPDFGNILKKKLRDIWVKGFHEYRFGTFKCCKDYCNNVQYYPCMPEGKAKPKNVPGVDDQRVLYGVFPEKEKPWDTTPRKSPMILYGVQMYAVTPVYSVQPNVVMYAVTPRDEGTVYMYGAVDEMHRPISQTENTENETRKKKKDTPPEGSGS